jgi:hypothetical protein
MQCCCPDERVGYICLIVRHGERDVHGGGETGNLSRGWSGSCTSAVKGRVPGTASAAISIHGTRYFEIAMSLRSSVTAPCVTLGSGSCFALPRPSMDSYLLHGPGQPLARYASSPSPCSRRNDGVLLLHRRFPRISVDAALQYPGSACLQLRPAAQTRASG